MNPLTDLSTKIQRADGTIVEIIQPGAKVQGSKHWRLTEAAYRRYETHIRAAIAAWPNEIKFDVPPGMSPNTFEHRFRDAMQAIKLYGYDADVQQALRNIRTELVVSMDPSGTACWIRARKTAGRPVAMFKSEGRSHPLQNTTVLPTPTEEVLRAFLTLGVSGHRVDPVQFKGRIDQALIDTLQQQFDTAFAYDKASDVTTMI